MDPQKKSDYHSRKSIKRTLKSLGASPDIYDVMYKGQKGCCSACNRYAKRLCIDHNHRTMKMRGLLCRSCNSALGLLGDSIETLTNLITYLKLNDA